MDRNPQPSTPNSKLAGVLDLIRRGQFVIEPDDPLGVALREGNREEIAFWRQSVLQVVDGIGARISGLLTHISEKAACSREEAVQCLTEWAREVERGRPTLQDTFIETLHTAPWLSEERRGHLKVELMGTEEAKRKAKDRTGAFRQAKHRAKQRAVTCPK